MQCPEASIAEGEGNLQFLGCAASYVSLVFDLEDVDKHMNMNALVAPTTAVRPHRFILLFAVVWLRSLLLYPVC